MKKYLVFKYELTGAMGGWHDFISDFDTVIEAVSAEKVTGYEEIQIVDRDTKQLMFIGDPAKCYPA